MQEPLVSFEGVAKRFGSYTAVQKMDLQIHKGEFLAIMGSSGCGKTTTLRMLAGLEAPSEGIIRLAAGRSTTCRAGAATRPWSGRAWHCFPFST